MSHKAVSLDRYGDTQLRIGFDHSEEPVVFTACSRALSRSSSIFRSMLYGETVGNEPGIISRRENQIIDVHHDTLVPMTTLLCIIHSKFDQVPPALSVDELYDLVVVARKYDMMTALRPWTAKWTKILGTNTQSTQEEITKALWIYWELGQRDAFYLTARRLTVESRAPVNSCPDGLRTPPGIAEHIASLRLQTIQSLIQVFREMIQKLLVVDEQPRWCRHAAWLGPHRCESMILGSLTFCLWRAGLWPLPDAVHVKDSILDLYTKLKTVVIHDIGQATEDPRRNHQDCNPRQYLSEAVEQVMNRIPNGRIECCDDHFQDWANDIAKKNETSSESQ